MVFHYFRISLRYVRKNRFYAGLNLLSLAIAFATCTLILIYINHEISFEDFHTKANRIYRITHHFKSNSGFDVHWARVPVDFINELPNEFPEIEKLIRFQNHERKYVTIGENKFRPEHTYITDAEVFQVFDFHLLEGDPQTALASPYKVVITKDLAEQYFGSVADAMGQNMEITSDYQAEKRNYTINGIIENVPARTHLPVDVLISLSGPEERRGWAYVYILLNEIGSINELKSKWPAFLEQHQSDSNGGSTEWEPQPLKNIHLQSDLAREIVPNGNQLYVRILFFVGLFVLLIGLFNYINLNNALVLGRSREMGMRMILGSNRKQVMWLGMMESIGYSLFVWILGLSIAYVSLPHVEDLLGLSVSVEELEILGVTFMIALISGISIGIYPSFFLPATPAMQLVKQKRSLAFASKGGSYQLKRAMITLQFCASIMLIASTFIAQSQLLFLHNKKLGLTKEQIIAFPAVPVQVRENFKTFRSKINQLSAVEGIAACMEVPSREIRDTGPVLVEGKITDPDAAPFMDAQIISPEFLELLDIELVAGENPFDEFSELPNPEFSDDFTPQDYFRSRKLLYVINETAMRQLGWDDPYEALGQRINWSIGGFEMAYGPIAGVVKDFHQESLKHTIDPVVMFYEPIWLNTFLIKVHTDHIDETLSAMNRFWDESFPSYPFEYTFLDEMYDNLYKQEGIQLQLLTYLSVLAIFLAFMGLFALIAYSLHTRLKEVALRKVLGAKPSELVRLFGKEYIWLVLVSGCIAIPISYYFIQQWLQIFAYQVRISGWSYLLTLIIVVALLLTTISFQIFRHRNMNPAEVLREE